MRLINTKTLQLEKFDNSENRPQYAILSHRWVDEEEVKFQDMLQSHRKWLPGWKKIAFCCEQALREGLDYAWVDTCCINQDSSSELSEAINSMYNWYGNAEVCYAYLQDVDHPSSTSLPQLAATIAKSSWFSRAWTLQELIAPAKVIFYDSKFRELGEKSVLASELEMLIHIPASVLLLSQQVPYFSVAVKMSWASHREATRIEDIAYSLFGLFEVNMPLLYGEGQRAFIRLQEEIIRQSDDHSIFLWHAQKSRKHISILAPSPICFETWQPIYRLDGQDTKPYSMTNVGLQIDLPLLPYHLDTYVAILNCVSRQDERFGILLSKDSRNNGRWYRTSVDTLDIVTLSSGDIPRQATWQKAHITKDPRPSLTTHLAQPKSFYGIKINAPAFLDYSGYGVRPYALMAYNDWETKLQHGLMQVESQSQAETTLLSPSSFHHLSHFFTHTVPAERLPTGLKTGPVRTPGLRGSEPGSTELGVFEMPIMAMGVSGIVFFDRLVHGIRGIKVGFDFDFRPVVFLATHEAGNDPQMQNWLRQWRFKHLDDFVNSPYLQRDLQDDQNFWRLRPDVLRTEYDHGDEGADAPIQIHKGIYGFRSLNPKNVDHWTFKPFEHESWHITLSLQKRTVNNLIAWELKMDRVEQMFELNIQVNSVD